MKRLHTAILALVWAITQLAAPLRVRLADLPRRARRTWARAYAEAHARAWLHARGLRPIAGGAITDVTDGSRVVQQGIGKVEVVLSAACKAGDLLGESSGTWVLADGNNTVYAELVAATKGASGDTITAYRIARVSGLSGGALGDQVYLSDTAGAYSATAGTVGQLVGICMSATEVLLFPQYLTGGQLVVTNLKIFFRDSGLFIHSNADGKLTISADGTGADDITLAGTVTVSDTITQAEAKGITQSGAAANTFGQITILDGKDIVLDSTTGTKIGTATTQKLGFYNATPAAQPGAYTQTYATAEKTNANPTQNDITAVANVEGASANNEFQDSAGANPTQAEWRVLSKTLKVELNAIKADIADAKQLLNSVIDDLQALGLVG